MSEKKSFSLSIESNTFLVKEPRKKKQKKKLVFLGFYKNRKKKGERKKLLQKIIKIRNHTKM